MGTRSGDAHLREQVVRLGLLTSVLACAAAGVYLASTPDAPNRPALWALTIASLVITSALTYAKRTRRIPRHAAMRVLHGWSASQTALIGGAIALDGGLSSPYCALLFLPLVASSIGFRPPAVVAHGAFGSVLLVAAATLGGSFDVRRTILWLTAICLTTAVGSSSSRRLLGLSSELDLANQRLAHAATTDSLTGCLNHGAFHAELELELSRRSDGEPPALLALDIDHFKQVNDQHGHPVGDQVLTCVADAIRANVRDGDLVGRTGGEEFAVLLPATSLADAERVGRRVRAAIATCSATVPVTASVGLASAPPTDPSAGELMRRADDALYEAKRSGRDRMVTASSAA